MALSGSYADNATSGATANVNLAGMSIGGGGRKLDSPAFLRNALSGTVKEDNRWPLANIAVMAGIAVVAVLMIKRG